MSSIVLDAAAVAALKNCKQPAIIRDSNGAVVGLFEPPKRIYNEGEISEIDEAELDRREREWKGIPSSEVRRMLEDLR